MGTMPREERKQLVYAAVCGGFALSVSEVGRSAGLRVSPYLRALLWELVDEGLIAAMEVEFPNGTVGYKYLDARYVDARYVVEDVR